MSRGRSVRWKHPSRGLFRGEASAFCQRRATRESGIGEAPIK